MHSYPIIQQTKDWNIFLLFRDSVPSIFLSNNPTNQGLKHYQGKTYTMEEFKFLSNNPTNQGLKQVKDMSNEITQYYSYPIIQQTKDWNRHSSRLVSLTLKLFLSNNPTNQGLKLKKYADTETQKKHSYPIIQQTKDWNIKLLKLMIKILMHSYPIIQQTKDWNIFLLFRDSVPSIFLSNNPTNQGLKHYQGKTYTMEEFKFLSNNPTNQGLKLINALDGWCNNSILIQ